jgi:hypothetical protein
VSKHGWARRQQTSLTQTYKNLFFDMTGASVAVVIVSRSSLSTNMYFLYIILFSHYMLY